ncbi:MAG: porin family protein [Candidatus Saccharicenans sp.]
MKLKIRVRWLALLLLTLLVATPVMADIQFGLRAGANLAKFTGADIQEFSDTIKNKAGLVAGIFLSINFGKIITIQPEVLYSMKGAALSEPIPEYSGKLYADYLEIPLLLKLRLPLPVLQPVIFAGPSVGFKLKEKYVLNGQTVELQENLFQNNDYGAIFGAGLDLGRHLQFDFRYSLGLKKVISAAQGETPPDIKNGVWSITVGLAF